jgi:hypothetical protein
MDTLFHRLAIFLLWTILVRTRCVDSSFTDCLHHMGGGMTVAEYHDLGDCWVLYRCGEYYPTDWLRSINEHQHTVLKKKYDKRKWPGRFAGIEMGCKATGFETEEFQKKLEHTKTLYDILPGGRPKPLICVFAPGVQRTWLSNPPKETLKTKLEYKLWKVSLIFRGRCFKIN